ncbi:hypothetical protein EJB05_01880 [Eragrostis curvula]|uniref:DUF659 domain-containing protein n=1 Tax=Eragrostis curvula TaxID=38414 RepID=A0A5J9WRE9_9POAL|nr:hypothetical protein EJB05_01880 [Eragrostis curvula]
MATPETEVTTGEEVNVLKRKSDDVGWEYGVLVDPKNKDKKSSEEAKEKCKRSLDEAARKKKEKIVRQLNLREEVDVSRVGGAASTEEEVTCVGSSEPHKLGPIDKWTRTIDPKATQAEALHQQKINKELWKQRTHDVQQYVARWMYTHAIPFNAINNDEFLQMCEAIGQFGPGFEPPSMDQLRGVLLTEEYERTKSLVQEREAEKLKNGCSIMTDAWSDRKRRSIMNLVTNCADGTSFMSSKEMSAVSHTSEVIFELVDKAIEEVGEDEVVQVVTDNASNNMGAKKMLFQKRPRIFWTSCGSHTINLMLQGIGSLPKFKTVLDQAKAFTIFVYGHTRTLDCMRQFTNGREIIRPGVTRFASAFLTLTSILEKKDQLRKMVVDSKWETLRDVKSNKGKNATTIIMDPTFWIHLKSCLSVFEPLVKVLRLADGDVKPSMGFLFGELTKAKREIKQSFGNMEARYKDVMAIVDKKMKGRLDSPLHLAAYLVNPHYSYADTSIFDDGTVIEGFITCVETFYHGDEDMQDQVVNTELRLFQTKKGSFAKKLARTYQNFDYNPASWWRLYGTETPGLQRLAVRILSLTSSSSGCERNWSIFEQIHTKRRNRLTTERLNLLVFIQFNSKLMSKREKIKSKKISDVLVSNETTEAQGFLFEGGDDCAMVIYRDEEDEEMAGTNMPWSVIGEAMGVDDQFEQRRSARMRDLYVEEEFESEEEDFAEDQDLMCD